MKTALALISLLFASPAWAATAYTINFTTSSGTAPTLGSFDYDSTTGFSSFTVVWDGFTYDLTSLANVPFVADPSGCFGSTPNLGFVIMSQSASGCSSPITYDWIAQNPGAGGGTFFQFDLNADEDYRIRTIISSADPAESGTGDWTITAETAPEPSTLALTWFAVLSIACMSRLRRRAEDMKPGAKRHRA